MKPKFCIGDRVLDTKYMSFLYVVKDYAYGNDETDIIYLVESIDTHIEKWVEEFEIKFVGYGGKQ